MTLKQKNQSLSFLLLPVLFSVFILNCKKEDGNSNPNNGGGGTVIVPCDVNQNTMRINGLTTNFTSDTCYINGDTLYTAEYETTPGNGLSIRLSQAQSPEISKYEITNNILELNNEGYKAFMQLFINGAAQTALSGTLEVKYEGGDIRLIGCEIEVENSLNDNYSVDLNGKVQ